MLYGFLYILCIGFSSVLLEQGGLSFSPALILVFGAVFGLLYFNLINLRHIKNMYRLCWHKKQDTCLMNLSVFVIWVSTVYGVVYTGAAVFTFVFFASIGCTARIAEFIKTHKKPELWSIGLILVLLGIVAICHVEPPLAISKLKGLLLGIFGGVAGYYYLHLSGRFMKETGFTATQVLAVRFYLAVILGVFFIPSGALADLTPANLGMILAIICFNLIIPLYFSQKAVAHAGAALTGVIISCTPLVTALIESMLLQKEPHSNYILYAIYVLIVAIPYLWSLTLKLRNRS